MNIREAILKAADSIEQNPGLFQFSSIRVPDLDCGTPGCAIGWMAYHLGLGVKCNAPGYGEELYWVLDHTGVLKEMAEHKKFYDNMEELASGWRGDAATCANGLRLYANKFYPAAEKIKGIPVWCREIFEGEAA